MEWLLACERQYFQAIHGAHTVWQDRLMYAFTGVGAWIPLLLFPLYCAVRRRRDWAPALLCTLTGVAASLTVAEGLIKPFFKRLRPTHHPAFMQEVAIVNDYIASGDYGFISGHSTTAFAFAVMSALAAKNRRYSVAIFLWASLRVYSRVYLGAHFITDVIPGMMLGALIGWGSYMLFKFMQHKKREHV